MLSPINVSVLLDFTGTGKFVSLVIREKPLIQKRKSVSALLDYVGMDTAAQMFPNVKMVRSGIYILTLVNVP